MLRYVLRRFLLLIPMVLAASVIIFSDAAPRHR